jgi:hypothetical protein
VYFGRGELADAAAALDELERSRRRLEREELQRQQHANAHADGLLARLEHLAELLMHTFLCAAGYHLHERGEWRRQRRHNVVTNESPEPLSPEQIQDILDRAQQGDHTVLPELEHLLDNQPEIWRRCGDLAGQVQAAWIKVVAGENALLEQSLRRQLDEMRCDLEGGTASPLEKLLVGRVVACWLHTQQADAAAAQARSSDLRLHAFLLKRQESAQKRLLQATQRLAQVRKLLRPALSPFELAMRGSGDARVEGRGKAAHGRQAELACG